MVKGGGCAQTTASAFPSMEANQYRRLRVQDFSDTIATIPREVIRTRAVNIARLHSYRPTVCSGSMVCEDKGMLAFVLAVQGPNVSD